ncbi:MAG TPA: hypothetical protein PKM41_04215 [Deltaproteobacteria bacterium]|nr:hypothetical protein [Deltaproteobacteria bacterium]
MDMSELPIDDREYDPQDSEKLAEWVAEGLRGESETLYRTKGGKFFILEQGGFISRSSRGKGPWFGGSSIRPVTELEALEWCEGTGNYEAIETYFPFTRMLA